MKNSQAVWDEDALPLRILILGLLEGFLFIPQGGALWLEKCNYRDADKGGERRFWNIPQSQCDSYTGCLLDDAS